MTATTGRERALSWDEYAALPEDSRVEYVDGHLLVSPSPTRRHQRIRHVLTSAVAAVLPEGHEVISAWEWKPGADAFVPDVMVYERAAVTGEERFTGTPALVVEVLSTNRRDDLLLKMTKYAQVGLPRYWVVDPRERTLTTLVLDDGAFRPTRVLEAAAGEVELDAGPARLVLDVGALVAD
ncbi:Uma2 family endonuclease [Kineococcus terrestris]|uniref:Uma2 family endonuclease n=1 Tax=Kineococcus terrestris TaxID=2044856 RepID=UPI0034DB3576